MSRLGVGAAIAVAAVLFGGAADAAIMQATFTGTMAGNGQAVDTNGVFAAPGTDLSGTPFSLVYTYDTNLGVTSTTLPYGLDGGAGQNGGISAPIMDATFTVNGLSFSYDGAEDSEIELFPNYYLPGPGANYIRIEAIPWRVGNIIPSFEASCRSNDFMPTDFVTPFAFDCTGQSVLEHWVSPNDLTRDFYLTGDISHLDVSVITPDAPPGVPEPGTWLLLIAGCGLIGYALRTRHLGEIHCREALAPATVARVGS